MNHEYHKERSLQRLKGIAFDCWYLDLTRITKRNLLRDLYKNQNVEQELPPLDRCKLYFNENRWPIFLGKLEQLKIKYELRT